MSRYWCPECGTEVEYRVKNVGHWWCPDLERPTKNWQRNGADVRLKAPDSATIRAMGRDTITPTFWRINYQTTI